MTVITQKNRIDHTVVDVDQVNYTYDFRVDSAQHMTVFLNGDIQTPSSYIIYGLGDSFGGYIEISWPSAIQDEIIIMRVLPLVQQVDYVPYDKFPAETHELALDHGVMIDQQLQEEVDRCWKAPVGWPGGEFIVPEPQAGYTLVWREDERGFDNAPGEESFLSWVDRAETGADESEAARDVSVYWSNFSNLWAVEDEDVLVDDGVHPPDYSAYHWAQKAEEGGIIDIFSEDELMMVVNIPDARYRSLEMITGTPGGMVKLDNAGLVPLDNLPFSGSIRFIAPMEGHDRCPKYQYNIPDETPCVEPDSRNPSERVPSVTWAGGDYFVIVGVDEDPLTNTMNLINPDTQLYEIQEVQEGDAVIWLDGAGGVTAVGWYLYPGFATGDVLASDVIFDDSMTDIKGVNVQLWNQAADAVIADKVDQSGDLMTGNLDFMNEVLIRGYQGDAVTLVPMLWMSTNNHVIMGGGDANHTGDTRIRRGGQTAIEITGDPVTGYVALDRRLSLPNSVAIRLGDSVGAPSDSMYLSSANRLTLGSAANILGTDIYAAGVITLATTLNNIYLYGTVRLENLSPISALSNDGLSWVQLITTNSLDTIVIGSSTTSLRTQLYAAATVALDLHPSYAEFSGDIYLPNQNVLYSRRFGGTSSIILIYGDTGNGIRVGGTVASPATYIYGSSSLAQTINVDGTTFNLPASHVVLIHFDVNGAYTIPFNTNSHNEVRLSGATTLTFGTPTDGTHCYLRLAFANAYTITWPAGIYWQNGEAPNPTTDQLVVSLLFEGNTWWGSWGDFALA